MAMPKKRCYKKVPTKSPNVKNPNVNITYEKSPTIKNTDGVDLTARHRHSICIKHLDEVVRLG